MISRFAKAAVGVLVVLLAGCAQFPTQELSQYRNAFGEVHATSEEILIDFADAKQKAEEKEAAKKAALAAATPAGATPFSTELTDSAAQRSDPIEVRRKAFRTIDKFNNVLVTLAEGESVGAVKDAAGGFVQAAGKFVMSAAGSAVPGLSELGKLVQTVAGEFEKARLREEFEKAVRDGAPRIDDILVALSSERADHYVLRVAEVNDRQLEIVDRMRAAAVNARDVVAEHGPPTSGVDPLPELQMALDQALEPFGRSPTLAYSAVPGASVFDAQAKGVVIMAIAQIDDNAKAYRSNVAQVENLSNALNAYGAMIGKTRLALNLLVNSLDRPVKIEEASEALFEIAFIVRRDIEAFKAARAAAR